MRYLPLAISAAMLSATTAMAQTTTGPNMSGNVPGATPNAPVAGANSGTGTAAASGDRNQAVATTDANAPHPAHGSNSFSMSQARYRIAHHGFQKVSDLHKESGVWRGTGMKDGQQVKVWLDYKGKVGQE